MSDPDPLMEHFADLEEPGQAPHPGKRPPINRANGVSDTTDTQVWDEKPTFYLFGGVEREFFTISQLAMALGRSVVTIRSWEHKGLLPKTPYRSPRPKGEMLPGVVPKGMRLWTRDQILGILRIASEEGVIVNGKPPTKHFSDRVLDMFRGLLERDTQTS